MATAEITSARATEHAATTPSAAGEATPLWQLSATELGRRIRAGALSSRDAVEAHIARIAAVNPGLNALVQERFAAARAEADAADARLRSEGPERLPPFFGVPCTIKESFALTGMPNTAGLVARKGTLASADAPTVARLRAAGAIPLGVSNTSELCMWYESANKLYGRTNNAYDARRIPGGSSGGEGALIGAGASPFGLGSDIGGSIRMPAFFNGIYGHKPSRGVVPNSGQFPLSGGPSAGMLAVGPLCRRAVDLMPLLRVLAGPDGVDVNCVPMTLGDPAAVAMGGLDVLDVADDGRHPVDDELRAAQARVASALAGAGARLRRRAFAGFRRGYGLWMARLAGSERSFSELLGDGRPTSRFELLRWLGGRSPHTLPALLLALIEQFSGDSARNPALLAEGMALRDEVVAAIGDGVMLYPSHVSPAPRHHLPIIRPEAFIYTALINLFELPATQVPLGLGRDGVPLGVQVVAGPGRDHVTIAVAEWIERNLGGWVPPPRFPPR